MDRFQFKEIPDAAFRFEAQLPELQGPQEGSEDKARRFRGIAHSGEIIENHFWWGNLGIDIENARFNERVGVLVNHDSNQRAGHAQLSYRNGRLEVEAVLLDNEHGRSVAAEMDQGFPFEMSVHAEPTQITNPAEGAKIKLNGREFDNVDTVFVRPKIREVSLTPVGADSGTSAQAFMHQQKQRQKPMDETAKLQERIGALESKNEDLQAENDKFQAQVEQLTERAETAEAKAEQLEGELTEFTASQRTSAIQSLAKDLNREFSEDEIKRYAAMDAETFEFMAGELRKSQPKGAAGANGNLFRHQADNGSQRNNADPSAFAAEITAYQLDQAKKGRNLSAARAAAELKEGAQ